MEKIGEVEVPKFAVTTVRRLYCQERCRKFASPLANGWGKSVGFWLLFSVRLKSYRKFTHKNKSKLMQHDATRKSEDTRLGEIAWSLQVTSEHLQSPTIALNGIQLAWLAVQPSGSETEVLSFPQIGCLVTGHGQPISDDPSPPTQRRRSHLVSPAEALMDGLCHPLLVHLGWSAGVIMNS